jgi:hypothetical protein
MERWEVLETLILAVVAQAVGVLTVAQAGQAS